MSTDGKSNLGGAIYFGVVGSVLVGGLWLGALRFDPPHNCFGGRGCMMDPFTIGMGAIFFGALGLALLRYWRKLIVVGDEPGGSCAVVAVLAAILLGSSAGFGFATWKSARIYDFAAAWETGELEAGFEIYRFDSGS